MAWFKVDDGLCFHPKAIAAGNSALGLWVRAGSWCGANLTGGALPRHMIGTFGAQKRDAQRLVEAGLWCETEEGYQFKSWEEFQPTKAQVEADRKAGRERQAKWRERHSNGGSNAVTNSVTNGATNAAPSRPDPTVVPSGTTSEGARKRATRLPSDWAISQDLCDWAVDQGYSPPFVMAENAKFIDYWNGIPGQKGTKLDWPGTWRNWIRRAAENHRPNRSTPDPVGRLERTLQRVAERQNTPKELPR